MNLNFRTKRSSRRFSDADISISYSQKTKKTFITFRNGVYLRISKTDYMTYATTENRVYFKDEIREKGFKMSDGDNPTTRYATFKENLSSFIGDYILEYDKELKLNYVNTENKIF